jgi:hypothetical protein
MEMYFDSPMSCHGGVLAFIDIYNKNCKVARLASGIVFTHHSVECVPGKSNSWPKQESLEDTWLC